MDRPSKNLDIDSEKHTPSHEDSNKHKNFNLNRLKKHRYTHYSNRHIQTDIETKN
jgi:hypothetical protein